MTRKVLGLLLLAALVAAAGCEHTPPQYPTATASAHTATNATDPRFTSYVSFSDLTASNPPSAGMKKVELNDRIDPNWLQPPTELFTLGPGDRLEIEVLGEPASRATTVVAPDGKLY